MSKIRNNLIQSSLLQVSLKYIHVVSTNYDTKTIKDVFEYGTNILEFSQENPKKGEKIKKNKIDR